MDNLLQTRRAFLQSTTSLAALCFVPLGALGAGHSSALASRPRRKKPAIVRGAFFYPPADVVLEGKNEDSWAAQRWFTWPGNQFRPEEQQARFNAQLQRLADGLDLTLSLERKPLWTTAAIQEFNNSLQASPADALVLFNFWNTFSPKMRPTLEAFKGPIILYQPVGANHQMPPEYLRTAPRVQYIHSIENWGALERGLRAVHTMNRMRQSRLLRVSGRLTAEADANEAFFQLPIQGVPAAQFNDIYDGLKVDREMERLARSVRRGARHVTDLQPNALVDAVRAHRAVQKIMELHEADAITIECLFLRHRKPCLSFSINNGNLVPCGCENDLNATLTLMLGASCFGCAGFQHNPEFDTEQNLYFGSHCTCATRLHGPADKPATYDLRPFFHQMPKTLALDVQWKANEPVTLCKFQTGKNVLDAWRGSVVSSPTCPPTGGCATRVLVKLENVADVTTVYAGPHPVLYSGDFAGHLKALAKLYPVELRTNI